MKLLALLVFLIPGLVRSNCFAANASNNFYSVKKIYLKIAKPMYIDVSQHYSQYGILGPESFINYVTLNVLDKSTSDTNITDKIVIGLNDYQAQTLNNVQTLEIYMEITPTFGNYPEFNSKVYRFVSIIDKNEFLSSQLSDLNWMNPFKERRYQIKIKSKSVSVSTAAIVKWLVNDSIEKDNIVSYEVLELADSLASAVFGKKINVFNRNYAFDSEFPYCLITISRSALKTDNGLSREAIYEVISIVPVKE